MGSLSLSLLLFLKYEVDLYKGMPWRAGDIRISEWNDHQEDNIDMQCARNNSLGNSSGFLDDDFFNQFINACHENITITRENDMVKYIFRCTQQILIVWGNRFRVDTLVTELTGGHTDYRTPGTFTAAKGMCSRVSVDRVNMSMHRQIQVGDWCYDYKTVRNSIQLNCSSKHNALLCCSRWMCLHVLSILKCSSINSSASNKNSNLVHQNWFRFHEHH